MLAYCRLMLCFNYRARGGHDLQHRHPVVILLSFNYRARGGHDLLSDWTVKKWHVSTTVPAEGTTSNCKRFEISLYCFNYRARGGHDLP